MKFHRLLLPLACGFVAEVQSSLSCHVQADVSFVGFDIFYNVTAPGDYLSCLSQCVSTPLCSAFTLLPPGRCFLKTDAGPSVTVSGAMSCANVANTPSRCPVSLTPCSSDTSSAGACTMYEEVCLNAPNCPSGSIICPDGTCVGQEQGWASCPELPTYYNTSLSLEARVDSIVSNLSLEEIAPQLNNQGYGSGPPGPPGIARLSIPPYNWLNEGLHGVARSGLATSFPQISVAGCSFNRTSWWWMGRVLGLEARAKHIMYARQNSTNNDYTGVTYYAPNLNLGRNPLWGRIQEVPSEDPTLMSAYGISIVLGAQDDEDMSSAPPEWLVNRAVRGTKEGRRAALASKRTDSPSSGTSAIIACCKHVVAYSVEEYNGIPRAKFNAIVTGMDLLDSYLPAFQSCFMQGGGRSSMCSYNAVNGVPTCASAFLLNTTIRQRYGRGDDTFIMSDYSAIQDTWGAHAYCKTAAECIAKTVINGVDQDGGGTDYDNLPALVANATEGLTDEVVRKAATRLFRARIGLGILDPPESQPWTDLDIPSVLDTEAHRAMSLDAATQGIVLLVNNKATLPLSRSSLRKVAVVGPNADVPSTLYGNYEGTPPYLITPRMGMVAALGGDDSSVYFASGCDTVSCNNNSGFADAVNAASQPDADAVIVVLGIDQTVEREGTDRANLTLPGLQIDLADAVCTAASTRSVPCIVVYITGGPISDSWPVTSPLVSALVLLGYASQSAGTALANVLLGVSPPAGKLAVTWPMSLNDVPPMVDMNMRPNSTSGTPGRTYRFNARKPLFGFGFGLSYSSWNYFNLSLPTTPVPPCAGIQLSFTLQNKGLVDSPQVAQIYISYPSQPSGSASPPIVSLAEFDRVWVPAGGLLFLNFTLTPHSLALVNASTASTFGQDFSMSNPSSQESALSGAAFGVDRNYHEAALVKETSIGWDDMFFLPTGVPIRIWVGNSQPGQQGPGSEGVEGVVSLAGSTGEGVNLATCDLD